MFSFFKSSKKKTPKKGASFYSRENLVQTAEELSKLSNHLDSKESTITDTNIVFQGFNLDEINEKTLEKNFGEEAYILNHECELPNHKVYYYRIESTSFRFLVQIHFSDGKFFFAGTKVYADSLLSEKQKLTVTQQIARKYLSDPNSKENEFNITDKNGNVLYTKDDVFYYLKYVPNNELTRKIKKQYGGYLKPDLIKKEAKDALDRFI